MSLLFKYKHSNSGYILLLSVIIIGGLASSITLFLLLSGTSISQTFFYDNQAVVARSYANSCADTALQEIRNDTDFVGIGEIVFSAPNSCLYEVLNTGGETRIINAHGKVESGGLIVQYLQIIISDIQPSIIVDSWGWVEG